MFNGDFINNTTILMFEFKMNCGIICKHVRALVVRYPKKYEHQLSIHGGDFDNEQEFSQRNRRSSTTH